MTTTIPRSVTNAQSNLTHYITMLMEEAGLTVDSDTHAELDEIITPVFEELNARIAKLEHRLIQDADYQEFLETKQNGDWEDVDGAL